MLLYRGDHLRNARGFPQKIEGGAEAIQQAMIRLSVPKGSFTLDEELEVACTRWEIWLRNNSRNWRWNMPGRL